MIDFNIDKKPQEEILTMPDYVEFFVFGLPIETELGYFHPLKVRDYPSHLFHLQTIQSTKEQIIQIYRKLNKGEEFKEIFEQMEKLSLFEIALSDPHVRNSYEKILDKCFNKEKVIDNIQNEEMFDYYRGLILRTNVLKEEKVNPNPEIQAAIERSRRLKNQGQEKFTLSDMVSSVAILSGISYQEIMEWTVYQLHMSFYRVSQLMNYNTGTLFATVTGEMKEVENWSKHIDLFEEEKYYMTHDQFNKNVKSKIE